LPNATAEQRVATGFHRNTQINEEGGIDREQFRVESVIDRVNTTGSAFLGLTVGCCQCHDHKFDPLSQKEYYQLFAFFNSGDEPNLEIATPEQLRQRKQTQDRIAALEKRLKTFDSDEAARLEKWVGSLTPESKAMLPANIQAIIAIAPNGRNAKQEQTLLTAFRNVDQTKHVVAGLGGPYALLANTQLMSTRRQIEEEVAAL